ncbi:MAG: hypothetical protein Q8L35_03875 [Actinomycetota bacterium]|nr:hypothetical protein [Actinomycetota bacterium]
MVEPLDFDNVKVEFLYPFKISGWRRLRQCFLQYSDDQDDGTAFDGAVATSQFVEDMNNNFSSCAISSNLRFMEMLTYNVNQRKTENDGLLWSTCHSHERLGTRPYCIKDEPFMILCLEGEELSLLNPERLPDLGRHLPDLKIRVRSTVKLLHTGFGIVTIKFHLLTPTAVGTAIDDIVHSTVLGGLENRIALARELADTTPAAIKYRDASAIFPVIQKYELRSAEANELTSKLCRLIEEATLVKSSMGVSEIIDLQNLDRGSDWGREPHFSWDGSRATGAPKLYHYFLHLLGKDVIARIKEAVADNGCCSYTERMQLTAALKHNTDWHAAEGEFPYVLTTITTPDVWRKHNSSSLTETAEYVKANLFNDRSEVARLLMKSKWESIRVDWEPIKEALTNLFYSDLLYMAVHLRGALCVYYLPVDPLTEYRRSPELLGSAKYREEFKITLCDQRILWYIYTMHNQLISRDMTDISKHYEELRAKSHEENFPEIFDGLSHIVTTIEDRKVALSDVMEDPLSRRGGSSLFAEMIDSSSRAFRLPELYDSLKHKLERLDMLGIHVSEGINEMSNLIVSESSRGAQITLEILESLIVGVYAADLVKFAANTSKQVSFPLEHGWSLLIISAASFMVALPWVTLIRKYRTRIAVSEPPFQAHLEQVFATAGPIGLAAIGYLFMVGAPRLDIPSLLMTALASAIVIGAWWVLSRRYEEGVKSVNLYGKLPGYVLNKKS